MSEDLIIKHCSPTLAGLKTANLFSYAYSSQTECLQSVARLNKMFASKGVRVLPLGFKDGRALIYVFRPQRLARDLSDEKAKKLLRARGYGCDSAKDCIKTLKNRVSHSSRFPHEIGLFLGYPPEDVRGFIVHKGSRCKCCGCWKVYGNEENAVKQFAKFKKCSDIYYSKWLSGTPLQKLTVAC